MLNEPTDSIKQVSDYWLRKLDHYEDTTNKYAEKFSDLEITIGSFIAGLLPITIFTSQDIAQEIKYLLFLGFFSASLSLVCGLINAHIKQKFWQDSTDRVYLVNTFWRKARKNEIDEASAWELTSNVVGKKLQSPRYPWILQSLFLFLSIVAITLAFFAIIFPSVIIGK